MKKINCSIRVRLKELGFDCSLFGVSNKAGVYIVVKANLLSKTTTIIYIGSSSNMHKRVYHSTQHIYRKQFDIVDEENIIACYYKECFNYMDLEKELIKEFKPKYNKRQYKNN